MHRWLGVVRSEGHWVIGILVTGAVKGGGLRRGLRISPADPGQLIGIEREPSQPGLRQAQCRAQLITRLSDRHLPQWEQSHTLTRTHLLAQTFNPFLRSATLSWKRPMILDYESQENKISIAFFHFMHLNSVYWPTVKLKVAYRHRTKAAKLDDATLSDNFSKEKKKWKIVS